jgi:DNA-binding response OmpR family regulator
MRLLLAEDEEAMAEAVVDFLEYHHYEVDWANNGIDALEHARMGIYDVLILDIMMPGMDGLEVLSRIRREHLNTPVLMLTARSEIEDRVNGLESGADDYLTKPYATSELIARIRALGRRSEVYTDNIKTAGDLILDGNRYEMRVKDRSVKVTNKEYQLLELFISYPGFVFSSEHLMDKIWGLDSESEIDVVWTHIGFIRKKLKNLNAGVEIRTVRGAGYSLEIIK